jgi:hypothetical protein
VRSPQIFISETSQVPKKTDVSGSEFSDKIGPADLTPDFSTTGRLVKSDFQGEIGHEEVEIH